MSSVIAEAERPTAGDLASTGLDALVVGAAFVVVGLSLLLEALLRMFGYA